MNRRAFTNLVIVSAVFVVLAILGLGRGGSELIAGDSAGTPLFAGLGDNLDRVTNIVVDGPGRERLVSLSRNGDQWVVDELDGYPADRSKVNAALIDLSEATVVEEKTANPEFHARLGVESIDSENARGLQAAVSTDAGDTYRVVLGDTYTAGQRYARLADDNLSVLIDSDPDISLEPSEWVDTEILNIAPARIQRVEITHTDGEELVMTKGSRDDNTFAVQSVPEGRELQYAGVADVTGNLLQNLTLEDVRRSNATPNETDTISEFWTFDGLVVTVSTWTSDEAEAWIDISARFDADQALSYATNTVASIDSPSDSATDASDDGEQAESDSAAGGDAIAEAESLNARLGAWQYRIPSYQLSQLTRRMEDLLQPLADE